MTEGSESLASGSVETVAVGLEPSKTLENPIIAGAWWVR
jgi:hypothetical protein